jgi:hypothetical protein
VVWARGPWLSGPENGVEDDEELSHKGSEDELWRLPCGSQPVVAWAKDRIAAGGDESGHVESAPDGATAGAHAALALALAAVVGEGCDASQGGDLLA